MRHFRVLGSGIFAAFLLLASSAHAQTVTTIYKFDVLTGRMPVSIPVFDSAGNLYGATAEGGHKGKGVVYKLTPNGSGGWSELVIHDFGITTGDGANAYAEPIFDQAGNLYGTTEFGGSQNFGAVYKLSPNQDGTWSETLLHEFTAGTTDGNGPAGAVTFDAAGNLWGTTLRGGKFDGGVIFELSPQLDGTWSEQIPYHFDKSGKGGFSPRAKLISDAQGSFYGTTASGAFKNGGTVFQFTPDGQGSGTYTPLHQFGGSLDGVEPLSALVFDAQGNLFGTTFAGGKPPGNGTAFELSPNGTGGWVYKKLVNFALGQNPRCALVSDGHGGFYGTTYGLSGGNNFVFQLSSDATGLWSYTKISGMNDGKYAQSGVVWGVDGNLYGTASSGGGGVVGAGTVYQVTLN